MRGPQWLSTNEAAELLGITPHLLYKMINEGKLTGYRVGRSIRLKSGDIDKYLESCKIQPGQIDHLCRPAAYRRVRLIG